jgi:hypothetical protein
MQLRWSRLVVGALVAEFVPVALLVVLVAVLGPDDAAAATAYAESLGRWVGPIGGAVMTFLAAVWVARPMRSLELRHGVVLGILAALLDVTVLVASGAPFEGLFLISNAGRIIAGTLGGLLASRVSTATA